MSTPKKMARMRKTRTREARLLATSQRLESCPRKREKL